jgi:ABC-type branched-subunit amino acid transport system substrate-binding protein
MVNKLGVFGMLLICLLFWGTLGPAQGAEKPIKIGVVFIMSGPMGGYGKHGSQAVQLALDEINAQGGVLGRRLEALFEDDKMQPERGLFPGGQTL